MRDETDRNQESDPTHDDPFGERSGQREESPAGRGRQSGDSPEEDGSRFRTDRLVFVPIALLLMFISFAVGRAMGGGLNSVVPMQQSIQQSGGADVYKEVFNLIKNEYVEPIENPEELVHGALNGMIGTLSQEPYDDPYSGFFEPSAYDTLKTSTSGDYVGIGVEITPDQYSGYPRIVRVFAGSPAESAGLQEDDRIVKVKGKSVENQPLELVVEKIKGKQGTTVQMTVNRPGEEDNITLDVERDEVTINAVVENRMVAGDIGYIKMVTFNNNTTSQFQQAISDLKSEGMEGLILDLRGNTGGLLSQAISLTSLFLGDTQPVVKVKRRGEDPKVYYAGESGNDSAQSGAHKGMPLVILVNGQSASASEVLSGALRDHDSATLVGEKTFGKGVVQEVMEVGDGSMAVMLTIAKYLTPSGDSIHGEGIYPDVPYTRWDLLQQDEQARELYDQIAQKRSELRELQSRLSDRLEDHDLVLERGKEIMSMKLSGEQLPETDSKKEIEDDQEKLREEYILPRR